MRVCGFFSAKLTPPYNFIPIDCVMTRNILLIMVAVLVGCAKPGNNEKVEFRVPVTVEAVAQADMEDIIVTTGTVRASEVISLSVVSRGILEILDSGKGRYAEGDFVAQNQQIAVITGEDARLAARLSAAQQRLQTARKNLNASLALHEQGVITDTELGEQRVTFEDAKLEYDRAIQTEQHNKIVTPIDGVIVNLARDNKGQLLANKQLVEPGQEIAQVAPMNPLVADVDIVGTDIAKVKVGLKARVRYHAWKNRDFEARVLRLAPTIDDRTRALRAEVEIDNKDGLLRPGMFVEVVLVNEVREDVPRVPRRSVTDRSGKQVVFVLDGQRVKQQEVELGLGDDQWVEIRKGLVAGDHVVVLGLETLTDQMPVRATGL